jgi:hypothetical protein
MLDRADGIDLAGRRRHAARPPFAGQAGGRPDRLAQRLPRTFAFAQHVHQPLFQAPAPPAPALGSADPPAQLRGLLPRQGRRKGAVGGVEEMVALVEDDALHRGALDVGLQAPGRPGSVECGLGHHQRVVGDDEIGAA